MLLNKRRKENVESHQKKIPLVQGQRRSLRDEITFSIKPHTCQTDAQRPQTNLVQTKTQRPHRDRDRTVFECLLRRFRSAVAGHRGRGSGRSTPGCGISPLIGGHHQPSHKSCQNLCKTGGKVSRRAQTKPCVHQDPGERSHDPTRG